MKDKCSVTLRKLEPISLTFRIPRRLSMKLFDVSLPHSLTDNYRADAKSRTAAAPIRHGPRIRKRESVQNCRCEQCGIILCFCNLLQIYNIRVGNVTSLYKDVGFIYRVAKYIFC